MFGVSVFTRVRRHEKQQLIKENYALDETLIKNTRVEKILNNEDKTIFEKLVNNHLLVDDSVSLHFNSKTYVDIKYYVYLIGIKNIVSTEYCCKITLLCLIVNLRDYNYMRFEITCHTRPVGTHVKHMGWYNYGKKFPQHSYVTRYSYSIDNVFDLKLAIMSNTYHPRITYDMGDEDILNYIYNYNKSFLIKFKILMSNKLTLILSYIEHDRHYNQSVLFDKCKNKTICKYPTVCVCGNHVNFEYRERFFK